MNTSLLLASLEEILHDVYRGRRVFVTGHNGFVGSWLSYILSLAGAEVVGYSLPEVAGGISDHLDLGRAFLGVEADIRDLASLEDSFQKHRPEFVFHLAAQPLVLPSLENPLETFSTNVMGTANVLEAVRHQSSVRSCVVITSDKCYATSTGAHDEMDPFGGDDPYSASKGAAEIVVQAYRHSFFQHSGPPIASARAGNIVGGGDWAQYRIVPDSIRAIHAGLPVRLRHPGAIRPWQHVLDAVAGYIRLGGELERRGIEVAEGWNFGPDPDSAVSVADLVAALVLKWRISGGAAEDPILESEPIFLEREYLTLNSSKAQSRLGWKSQLDFESTMDWTVEWYFQSQSAELTKEVTDGQIARFLQLDSSGQVLAPEALFEDPQLSSPPD